MNTARRFVALAIVVSMVSIAFAIETDNYIVGGQNARPGQFPSKVSLRTLAQQHFCGGVIINHYWFLTAAHCVANRVRNPNSVIVVTNPINRRSGTSYRIARIVIHPRFNPKRRHNDIGMLLTSNRIVIDQVIRPARLPLNDMADGHRATLYVAGLGLTRYPNVNGNGIAATLKFKRTVSISRKECRQALQNRAPLIGENSLCAVSQRGQGLCAGDGGSPLYNQRGVVFGIAAWSNSCGRGSPDIYTRINPYLGFIISIARTRVCSVSKQLYL